MVGVAIGLVIVAAASLLMAGQLVENRRMLTEAQVQQDLRATTDLLSREVRRAEGTAEGRLLATLWYPGSATASKNPHANKLKVSEAGNAIQYQYHPAALAPALTYKFTLSNFIITFEAGATQTMTDGNVMRATSFNPSVVSDSSAGLVLPCPNVCSDGSSNCWPKVHVRKVRFTMEAEATADANVQRALRSTVRVRNDWVEFAGTEICPT
jgi:type IV pilus assembly protein PilW